MKSRHLLIPCIVLLAATLWLGFPPGVRAYEKWGDGCTDCHSNFLNPTSIKPGNTWPGSKHNIHRSSMMTDAIDWCGTCHVDNGDDPILDFSRGEPGLPGVGCMGCHGVDPDPGTTNNKEWGSGLRQHHANSNVGLDDGNLACVDCHTDTLARLGENAVPVYYGGNNINVFDPCNADDSENWTSDGLGLDNDGDLDYDAADSDCSQSIFTDGFESGDTSNWSVAIP